MCDALASPLWVHIAIVMTAKNYIERIVTCIACSRMVLIRDPRRSEIEVGFWSKATLHITVCTMCESEGVMSVSTDITIYDNPVLISDAMCISADFIKTSNVYSRACQVLETTPSMGAISHRIPIIGRKAMLYNLPKGTQISYVSRHDAKDSTFGVRSYMVADFF